MGPFQSLIPLLRLIGTLLFQRVSLELMKKAKTIAVSQALRIITLITICGGVVVYVCASQLRCL